MGLIDLLSPPPTTLEACLRLMIFGPRMTTIDDEGTPVACLPVFNFNEGSGFQLSCGANLGDSIRFGTSASGLWVVEIYRKSVETPILSLSYRSDGNLALMSDRKAHDFQAIRRQFYTDLCPILNYLFCVAASEIDLLKSGKANLTRLDCTQRLLKALAPDTTLEIQALKDSGDSPLYSWRERRILRNEQRRIRDEKSHLIARAQGNPAWRVWLLIRRRNLFDFFIQFRRTPVPLIHELIQVVLFEPLRWFAGVVRGNLGYSIALAVYSPFTFFFITQPMNPKAMRAVGMVREAYLNSAQAFERWGTSIRENGETSKISQNEMTQWNRRMDSFKALEIAYEGNLELAPRLGRLEYIETQLNWALIMEGAWFESDRYLAALRKAALPEKHPSQSLLNHLGLEVKRIGALRRYLWSKNQRFIDDHPWILLDPAKEQPNLDPQVGRIFSLQSEMTDALHLEDPEFKGTLPEEVAKRASLQRDLRIQTKEIIEPDLRAHLRRQWEVLYLLQSRAQEASNAGLQLYTWSVRSAIQALHAFTATQREELALVLGSGLNPPPQDLFVRRYQALYHAMIYEFDSVKKEISETLLDDPEAQLRAELLDGLRAFIIRRETLLGDSREL